MNYRIIIEFPRVKKSRYSDEWLSKINPVGLTKAIIKKNKMKEHKKEFNLIQKKPITPSDEEVIENPPSRSAKFRYVIKKNDFYNLQSDISFFHVAALDLIK